MADLESRDYQKLERRIRSYILEVDILARQDEYIDLIKMAEESFLVVEQVYNQIMVLLIDKQVIEDCEYLVAMHPRTILVNATGWAVFDIKGYEPVEGVPSYIGPAPGIGLDYVELTWSAYEMLRAHISGQDRQAVRQT